MDRVRIADVEICYQILGQGPPLVMVMGFTANMDWWPPELINELSSRFTLILFDNRGAGRSSSGNRVFSIRLFASDTAGLMETLGIGRAHLMGVSMGGMIAQEFALRHQRMLNRLVLCCTACGGIHTRLPKAEVLKIVAVRSNDIVEQTRRSMKVLYPPDFLSAHPEKFDQVIEAVSKAPITPANAKRQIMAIARHSTYRRLPGILRPTLIMTGSEDVLVPPSNSGLLAQRIPDSRLKVFEGAGHGFVGQYPLEVAEAVSEFLSHE